MRYLSRYAEQGSRHSYRPFRLPRWSGPCPWERALSFGSDSLAGCRVLRFPRLSPTALAVPLGSFLGDPSRQLRILAGAIPHPPVLVQAARPMGHGSGRFYRYAVLHRPCRTGGRATVGSDRGVGGLAFGLGRPYKTRQELRPLPRLISRWRDRGLPPLAPSPFQYTGSGEAV